MSEQQPPGQPQGTPPAPPQQQPGQPYPPQQPYAGQPYAGQPSAGYPAAPAPAPSSTSASGALGRVAFIIALASLAIGLLIALGTPALMRAVDFTASLYGAILGVSNALVLIVAIVALILGLVAVRRPGQQILAGIAIGIAASEVLGILVSWVANAILTLTYS